MNRIKMHPEDNVRLCTRLLSLSLRERHPATADRLLNWVLSLCSFAASLLKQQTVLCKYWIPKIHIFYSVVAKSNTSGVNKWFYVNITHSLVRETSHLFPFWLQMLRTPLLSPVLYFSECLYMLCLCVCALPHIVPWRRKDAAVCSWSKPKRDDVAVTDAAFSPFSHLCISDVSHHQTKEWSADVSGSCTWKNWARWKLPASPSPFREPWE